MMMRGVSKVEEARGPKRQRRQKRELLAQHSDNRLTLRRLGQHHDECRHGDDSMTTTTKARRTKIMTITMTAILGTKASTMMPKIRMTSPKARKDIL